jgi:hypothetical protein
MRYRATALVAVISTMTLAGGPAVAQNWLPSWLDNVVNGSNSAAASSTDVSSKGVQAPVAQDTNRRATRRRHANRAVRERPARPRIVANQASAEPGASARCLSSAAAVRQVQPKAWPKWTHGPRGERCWYAGAKPVFAKRSHPRASPTRIAAKRASPPVLEKRASPPVLESVARAAPQPAPVPAPEIDGRNRESAPQPWALEYRWNGGSN